MKVAFLLLLGICAAWATSPPRPNVPSFQRPHPDPRPPPFNRPQPFRGRRDVHLRPAARPVTLPALLPGGRTGQLPPKHTLTRPFPHSSG
ncbi:hypothetical protein E2C01_061512 [Portunus trituberculatus]|uniref:Uncharacterized protein n=1 Tax=Portunus trituberculatus TaxID=210409 RepID=A0A5B7HEK4_PORTR|nr:hypothetical protein [Portunus trituberculatus]